MKSVRPSRTRRRNSGWFSSVASTSQAGTTAVASISTFARGSSRAPTTTTRHRRIVPAHDLAIGLADLLARGEVAGAIGDVPGQPHDVRRRRRGGLQHAGDVAQRLRHLRSKVVGLKLARRRIPADLAGSDDHATGARTDAIGDNPPARFHPIGLIASNSLMRCVPPASRKRCSLPVSVRGSVPHELDPARILVRRDLALHEVLQLLRPAPAPRLAPSPQHHEGLDDLPALRVRHADHRAFGHCRCAAAAPSSTSGPAML